jgi:predicted nucleic acid-binding protein
MTATGFIDTNVLVYAASNAAADQSKRTIARQLLAQESIGFSAQVFQEFYAVAVSKQRLKMTHDEAVAVLESLAEFPVWPISRELVLAAVKLKLQYQLSYWDAAIIMAAKLLGCTTVYSEDLSDEVDCDGIRVMNPFRVTA